MAMEIACCSRSFAADCTSQPPVRKASSVSARGSRTAAPPCPGLPSFLTCSASSSQVPASKGIDGHVFCPYRMSAYPFSVSLKRRSISSFAVEGKSTSSTTADADLPSPDVEQLGSTESSTGIEEQESIGNALSQMRQERVATGEENPSKMEEFWRGVLEETRLIEWPSLQKVLGTTGVVTSIIVGSSLVLLTVNAVLAQLSDAFFKNVPPA